MTTKPFLQWITAYGSQIEPEDCLYLILAGRDGTGVITLGASNVVYGADNSRCIDLLTAEADYFTVLNVLSNVELHNSVLRSGFTTINAQFKEVQVLRFPQSLVDHKKPIL